MTRTSMTGIAQARFDKLPADGFTLFNRWGTLEDPGQAVAGAKLPYAGPYHRSDWIGTTLNHLFRAMI